MMDSSVTAAFHIPAVARCIAAWKQVLEEPQQTGFEDEPEGAFAENGFVLSDSLGIDDQDPDDKEGELIREQRAARAYREAMPDPNDRESVRNFVACVSYGVLCGAVSEAEAPRLLSAARVVLTTYGRPPKDG